MRHYRDAGTNLCQKSPVVNMSYLTCKTNIKALHCEAKRAKMGLPKDLYKANLMAWTVKKSVKTPRQKFVHDFLFGGQ